MIVNKIIRVATYSAVLTVFILLAVLVIVIFYYAFPSVVENGYHFFSDLNWKPEENEYGALALILTTLSSAFIAIIIAMPLSLSIAILLEEYYKQGRFNQFLKYSIDILALVPSIVYGYWAWYFLIPELKPLLISIFGDHAGVIAISTVLVIIIIPYSASFSLSVISRVPNNLKYAAYALGAAKYRMIINVMIPNSAGGVMAGMLFSIARCVGETMALVFIIGYSGGLFDSTNTMTTVLAYDFQSILSQLHFSALVQIAFVLLLFTSMISIAGKYIMKRVL